MEALLWYAEWGHHVEFLKEGIKKKTPKALLSMPDIKAEHRMFWDAFFLLTSRRTMGFASPNPISMQDIESYLNIRGLSDEKTRNLFLRVIVSMDNEYLSYVRKRTPNA